MKLNSLNGIYVLAAIFLWLLSGNASAEITKYVLLNGNTVQLTLTPRSLAKYGLEELDSQHYEITLPDFSESRGRIAFIDNAWHGLLIHQGEFHVIEDLSDSESALQNNAQYSSRALSSDLTYGSCGVNPTPSLDSQSTAPIQLSSLQTRASQINYDQHCESTVDGVCLVAELTVVFDDAFQSAIGSSYQSYGAAILENVDLIYTQNFNIIFNQISLNFDAGNNISNSTNIETVLEDIAVKRGNGGTSSYDPNTNSLFHFLTGRDYDGDTIGLAHFPNYSSYPYNVNPVLCTPWASSTAQLIGSGSSLISDTSIVVAHEIGHNFGLDHDGEEGSYAESCNATRYIMGAYIQSGLSQFSSCSHYAIGPNISAVNSVESCFDFPIDISLDVDAISSTPSLSSFTFDSQLLLDNVRQRNHSVSTTGTITSADSSFEQVTLDGSNCTLSNSNRTYSCNLNSTASELTLNLTLLPQTEDIVIDHQLSFVNDGTLFETDTDNNETTHTILIPQPGLAPESLSATATDTSASLTWRDRASDEVRFSIERRTNSGNWEIIVNDLGENTQSFLDTALETVTTYEYRVNAIFADDSQTTSNAISITTLPGRQTRSSPTSSGGGGGSFSWLMLPTLILLLQRRRRSNCDRPHN